MISSNPASGMLKLASVAAMTTSEARGAGHALAGEHQKQEHRNLLSDRQLDIVSLRDEQRGKCAVHHGAVEIERVAHRQNEADDLLADRELLELLHSLGIGCLAARSGEREQKRLADQLEEPEAMAAADHEDHGE